MKKIISAVLVFITAILVICSCSWQNPYDEQIDSGFEIRKMDVTIEVLEDSTARVREEITVRFLQKRRGIIRDLPTNSGESYQNISLEGDKYFISTYGSFICVNTGTSDNEVSVYYDKDSGNKTYILTYDLIPPKKAIKNGSYYMNVVGQGWATTIYDVNVNVSFPYSITDCDVIYGKWGEVNYANNTDSSVTYSVSGKTLNIKTDKLFPYNGITIDCKLESKLGTYFNYKAFLTILAVAVIAVIFLLLKLFKRRTDIIEVVNFYPPSLDGRQLNPAEAGILIDSTCDASDITALIFYWANKGNLLIEGENKDLTLIKLVDLDNSAPEYERNLYNQIFASSNRVTIKSLENKIYVHITKAQNAVRNKYKKKLYKHTSISVFIAICAVLLTAITFYLFGLTVNKNYITLNGFNVIVPVGLVYILGSLILKRKKKMTRGNLMLAYFALFASIVIGTAVCVLYYPTPAIVLSVKIGSILASLTIAAIAPFFADYTPFYASILGELMGFKNFLINAEKDRLEVLIADNPQYYYNILPYANVLGVTDVFQDKFKRLTIEPPSYYKSPMGTVFDIMIFNALYRNMFKSINTTAISRPSNQGRSGGGFGGGGGFSGGGFGGGGGRSR